MSTDLKIVVNVYAQSDYCSEKNVEYILKMLVPIDMYVSTLVEQIVIQNNPTADYTMFGLVLSGQGKWLQGFNTVAHYGLKDNDVLDLLCKRKKIKVKTLDGSTRTVLIDETLTVGVIVEGICGKLGINNYEEYSLMLEDLPGDDSHKDKKPTDKVDGISDKTRWLRSGRLLREQGAFDAGSLILKRRFFFNHDNVDESDPFELNLLYSQIQMLVAGGQCPCTLPTACMFAATQLQVEHGDYNAEKYKHTDIQLKRLVPADFAKKRDIKKLIGVEYAKLVGTSSMDAKLRYFKLFKSLPTCGATFFYAEIVESNKKNVPVFLGVSRTKIILLDYETRKSMSEWSLQQMRRWSVLLNTLTIDLGDYADAYIRLKCSDSETVSDLIFGYINILLKRHQLKKHKSIGNTNDRKVSKNKYYTPGFKTNSRRSDRGSKHVSGADDDNKSGNSDVSSESAFSDQNPEIAKRKRKLKSKINDEISDENMNSLSGNKKDQFETYVGEVANSVKATNKYFKINDLRSSYNKKARSNLSQFNIPQSNISQPENTNNELDKYIIKSDLALTISTLPEIILDTALYRYDESLVDLAKIKNDINTLLHSQASFVRSLRLAIANNLDSSDTDCNVLQKSADQFFSCVEAFTDRLKCLSIEKFTPDEYKLLASKLAFSSNSIGSALESNPITKSHQAKISQVNGEVLCLLDELVHSLEKAVGTLPNDAEGIEDREKLTAEIKKLNFSLLVPLAFIPAMSTVADNYNVTEYITECLNNSKTAIRDIIAQFESREVNPEAMDCVRKNAEDFSDSYFSLRQMIYSVGKDPISVQLEQSVFVCKYLENLLEENLTVREFAERMNELSLSTANMFNSPMLTGETNEEKYMLEKLDLIRKKVGEIYPIVMSCARDHASNMNDVSLREDLVNSIDKLKSAIQQIKEGDDRDCVFYSVKITMRNLFDSLNYLVSYSNTSLIPRYAGDDHPEFHDQIDKFSKVHSKISSALTVYGLNPNNVSSQIYLIKAARLLIEHGIGLVSNANELVMVCADPNVKGLIQKSTAQSIKFIKELQDQLSGMQNYPLKININSLMEQLDNQISDIETAKKKAAQLVQLEGYGMEMTHTDFHNSLKCTKNSCSQLMYEMYKGRLSSAALATGHTISALQCLSFAVLGMCSDLDDVDKRVVKIESVISFAKLLREMVGEMYDAIENPNLCISICEKYATSIKSSLRKVACILDTHKNLVNVYDLGSTIMNVHDLLVFNTPNTNLTQEESRNDMIKSVMDLSETVNYLSPSITVKNTNEDLDIKYNALYANFEKFASAAANYIAINCNDNEDKKNCIMEIINDSTVNFNSLVGSVVDGNCEEDTNKIEISIEHNITSLDNSLKKCIDVCKEDTGALARNVINSNKYILPLQQTVSMLELDNSSVELGHMNSIASENASNFIVAAANLNQTSHEVSRKIQEWTANIIKSISENKQGFKISDEDLKKIVSGTIDVVKKMNEYVNSVERTERGTDIVESDNSPIILDVINDAVENLNRIVNGINEMTYDELCINTRKMNDTCFVLNHLCKEFANTPGFCSDDIAAYSAYSKRLESLIKSSTECLHKLNESPDREESLRDIIKEKITEASDLSADIYSFARTPKIYGKNQNFDSETQKSYAIMKDSAYKLLNSARTLVENVNLYSPNDDNEKIVSEVLAASVNHVNNILYASQSLVKVTPIIEEYDKIRETMSKVDEKYRNYIDKNNPKTSDKLGADSFNKPQQNLEDELIDLTYFNRSHDYFGILDSKNFSHNLGVGGLDAGLNASSARYNVSNVIDLIKLHDMVGICDGIVNSATSGEGDIIEKVKKLNMMYDSVTKSSYSRAALNKNTGEIDGISIENVDSFKNDVLELVDACRDMITRVNVNDEKKAEISANTEQCMKSVKDTYEKILKTRLETYNMDANEDFLTSAIILMSGKTGKSVNRSVSKSQRQQDNIEENKLSNRTLTAQSTGCIDIFKNFKKHLDKCAAEAAVLGNKFWNKPSSVRPIIENLLKTYSQMDDYTSQFNTYNDNNNFVLGVNNMTKCMGFIIFKMLDTQRAWDDGLIYETKANQLLYDCSSEFVKYLNSLYHSFKEFVSFVDVRKNTIEVADSSIKNISEKIDLCKNGFLHPINMDEDITRHKKLFMEKSIKVVEKINGLLAISNGKDINSALQKSNEVLDLLSEISDASVNCAASRTPLNKEEQLEILNSSRDVNVEFRNLLNGIFDSIYARMNAENQNVLLDDSINNKKAFATFRAIKNLVSTVNKAGTGYDKDNATSVIENSKKVIEQSVENLKNGNYQTPLSCSGAAALTGTLNSSKELSNIIPDFIQKLTELEKTQSSDYTPVFNKFTNGIGDLVKAVSATSKAGVEGEGDNSELLSETLNFCQRSLVILDSIKEHMVNGSEVNDETLQEATKNINMAISRVAHCAESKIKCQSAEERNHPMNIAEQELWTVRDTIKDVCQHINASENENDLCKGTEENESTFGNEVNREIKNTVLSSLSILRQIHSAYRNALNTEFGSKTGDLSSSAKNETVSKYSRLVSLSKKFSFMNINLCQQTSLMGKGDIDLNDLVATCRAALSTLEGLERLIKEVIPDNDKGFKRVLDTTASAKKSFDKLISISNSSLALNKAETLISNSLQPNLLDNENNEGSRTYRRFAVGGQTKGIVKERVDEIDSRIKVIKMEKELDDARIGLGMVRKRIYNKERTRNIPPPVVS